MRTPRSSATVQLRDHQGAKVIVLDPVDSRLPPAIVEIAHSQGVKVVAYDRPIQNQPANFYISFVNEGHRLRHHQVAGRPP